MSSRRYVQSNENIIHWPNGKYLFVSVSMITRQVNWLETYNRIVLSYDSVMKIYIPCAVQAYNRVCRPRPYILLSFTIFSDYYSAFSLPVSSVTQFRRFNDLIRFPSHGKKINACDFQPIPPIRYHHHTVLCTAVAIPSLYTPRSPI